MDKLRIFCVEDHKPLARVIQLSLENAGYSVYVVHNGDQALAEAPGVQPDLFLLDVMMPGRDGFQILDALRREDAFRETPVIMMTAMTNVKSHDRAKQHTVFDFIIKPFKNDELVERVTAALKQREKPAGSRTMQPGGIK